MITATGLSMHFGGQTLFTGADLQLDRGQRYGIVGANGAGKSTLLRILAGDETPSTGSVTTLRSARLGVLEQDHFQYDDVPIIDVVMMGNPELWAAMEEKERVLAEAEDHFDDVRYGELEDIVLRFDGYGLEARAGKILEGLGIPGEVHRQPLRVLSGGFKLRALLAKTLASDPDLLFLDEPTNHLDILAIQWLEQFLAEFKGCAVVVSHDLRFLDAVCTHILDVDYQRVTSYKGNYTRFVERKEEDRQRMESEIAKRQQEIADHKKFIARFSAKATKARQANSRQKRMEKIVIEELPRSSRRHPGFRFEARRPSGREVLKVEGVSKAFGDKQVLSDVHVAIERGDRAAFIGPNGIGKSTLLTIAMGLLDADTGTARWGHECDIGYFPQDHAEGLGDPQQSVLSCLWDVCPDDGMGGVLARLGAVLFSKDDADKKVENLSGGEGARLLFARLAAKRPTVLVLDEPTNHLDLEGIEALATRIIHLGPDGIDDYRGSYTEYLERAGGTNHLDHEAVVEQARADKRRKRRRKGGKSARS